MHQTQEHSGKEQTNAGQPGQGLGALTGFDGPVQAFLPTLLEAVCLSVPDSEAAVYSTPPEGAPVLMACHPSAPQKHRDTGAWLQRVQQLIEQKPIDQPCFLPMHNSTGQQIWAQLALVPLRDPGSEHDWGVACLFVHSPDPAMAREALHQIQLAAQVIISYQTRRALVQREGDLRALSQAMQVLDAVNREPKFRPASIAMCNQAADTWKASRVSIGFLAGQYVKVRAMSHTEDISRKMQIVQDLEAAMEECLDQDSEVLVPQVPGATTINRQARLYAEKHGPTCMCLLPLRLHEDVVGAISVEWPSDHEISPVDIESLRLAANLITARLHQFHMDDRWFGARLATSAGKTAAVLVGPKHTWVKLVAIAVCAFLAFAIFVKGDNTVDSAFTVQTTQRQIITAPYEGTLLSVGEGIDVNVAVVGTNDADTPEGATLLAEMDTSELRVQREGLNAEIADYMAQADAARGENDLAAVEVAMANVRRLQAQVRLYDYRIDRSRLTSPISGVIIEGDLQQRINGTLDKGEVLFEIAPLDALRAELLVPASRIGEVRSSLIHPDDPSRGQLASTSHPGQFIGFTVERIEPEAEVVDGDNVFRVRVVLDELTPWLRPGVEGEARVFVDRRSYGYLWTRDAVNWVRMKLWF